MTASANQQLGRSSLPSSELDFDRSTGSTGNNTSTRSLSTTQLQLDHTFAKQCTQYSYSPKGLVRSTKPAASRNEPPVRDHVQHALYPQQSQTYSDSNHHGNDAETCLTWPHTELASSRTNINCGSISRNQTFPRPHGSFKPAHCQAFASSCQKDPLPGHSAVQPQFTDAQRGIRNTTADPKRHTYKGRSSGVSSACAQPRDLYALPASQLFSNGVVHESEPGPSHNPTSMTNTHGARTPPREQMSSADFDFDSPRDPPASSLEANHTRGKGMSNTRDSGSANAACHKNPRLPPREQMSSADFDFDTPRGGWTEHLAAAARSTRDHKLLNIVSTDDHVQPLTKSEVIGIGAIEGSQRFRGLLIPKLPLRSPLSSYGDDFDTSTGEVPPPVNVRVDDRQCLRPIQGDKQQALTLRNSLEGDREPAAGAGRHSATDQCPSQSRLLRTNGTLSLPSASSSTTGTMTYNAQLQRWEGIDVDLTGFEESPTSDSTGLDRAREVDIGNSVSETSTKRRDILACNLSPEDHRRCSADLLEAFSCFAETHCEDPAQARQQHRHPRKSPTAAAAAAAASAKASTLPTHGREALVSKPKCAQSMSPKPSQAISSLLRETFKTTSGQHSSNKRPSRPDPRGGSPSDFIVTDEMKQAFLHSEREHNAAMLAFLGPELFNEAREMGQQAMTLKDTKVKQMAGKGKLWTRSTRASSSHTLSRLGSSAEQTGTARSGSAAHTCRGQTPNDIPRRILEPAISGREQCSGRNNRRASDCTQGAEGDVRGHTLVFNTTRRTAQRAPVTRKMPGKKVSSTVLRKLHRDPLSISINSWLVSRSASPLRPPFR